MIFLLTLKIGIKIEINLDFVARISLQWICNPLLLRAGFLILITVVHRGFQILNSKDSDYKSESANLSAHPWRLGGVVCHN
jgi:hypothetical protein